MLGHREDFEALAAAVCYEPLTAEEQARFDAYCAKHPDWQAEAEELLVFSRSIPVPEAEYQGNLLPVVRAELAAGSRWKWWLRQAWVPLGAVCFIAVLAAYGAWGPGELDGYAAPEAVAADEGGQVAAILARVDEAYENRDFGEALLLLEGAVESFAGDPQIGTAQARLADLYFAGLQRYDAAYASYERLRREHPAVWNDHPEAIRRFNLLTETRSRDFEALHALDAAAENPTPFEEYERVIAQNPNSLVAMEAINRMRDSVGALASRDDGGAIEVASLELVRKHCTHPAAIAQVNLALGDGYLRHLDDREAARRLFAETAAQGQGELAAAANEALARLDNTP